MPEGTAGVVESHHLPPAEVARRRAEVEVLVLTGLGLNCEVETAEAFRRVGASPELVHLLDLLSGHAAKPLSAYQIVAFAGGFGFGDHLGAGVVYANKVRWQLYDQLLAFIDSNGLALGICNGFQMMTRLGMVPGFDGDYRTPRATIAPNDRLGYWDAWIRLRCDPLSPCVWTKGLDRLDLPTRHGEGKFLTESPEVLERLEQGHQIAMRYVDATGNATETWPDNPNGSPGGVAGVCDPTGRLFGLMPHPDAYLYPFQHPRWFRQEQAERADEGGGLALFRNGVDSVAFPG
jgi:phosphoribosylformylglycinamidine synthase